MFIRFLTYDLKYADTDDYNDLYNLIGQYSNQKITESTYKIRTSEDWDTFKNKFQKVTRPGDNIKVIVRYKNEMEVWTIR